MTPGDLYYARAIEFLDFAEHVTDNEEREALHKLAMCWLQMSDRAHEYWQHPQQIAA